MNHSLAVNIVQRFRGAAKRLKEGRAGAAGPSLVAN